MKRSLHKLMFIAALLLLLPLAAASAPPQKLTVQYDLSRNGAVLVEAIEVLEHDGKTYSLTSETKGKGIYAMIRSSALKRSSKGTVTPAGLRPDEFHEKRGDRPGKTARFDWLNGTVQQGEEGKVETAPMAAPERVSDRLILAWTFAFRAPVDKDASFAVSDGNGFDEFRFAPAGREVLKTPVGDMETLKLVKVPAPGDERGTEIWLAIKQNYVPVRVLVIEKDGTRIDQLVTAIIAQ